MARHEARLERNLEGMNLSRTIIEGDGDCIFASICDQLNQVTETMCADDPFKLHLLTLGLSNFILHSQDIAIVKLRELFVEGLLGPDKDKYISYIDGLTEQQYVREALAFKVRHYFGGQLGDITIRVMSDILQCPIVVVSSMESIAVVPFIPKIIENHTPLYLAFNQSGPGHYDITIKRNHPNTLTDHETAEVKQSTNLIKVTHCRCTKCGSSGGKYLSRCPCFRNKQSCKECNCKNCMNPFNEIDKPKVQFKVKSEQPRKRFRPSSSYVKGSSIDYLNREGECPTTIGWTKFEECLLYVIIEFFETNIS